MIVKAIERLLFGELYTLETGAKPLKRPPELPTSAMRTSANVRSWRKAAILALSVHLEKSTNRVAGGPNPLATGERLVWNVSLLAKATGCPEI